MKINEMFPSKYLAAADLKGKVVAVTMMQVVMEKIGKDERPVLYFVGANKGLVLNKTNGTTISQAFGDDTDAWTGKNIEIFPAMTEYQGKPTPCLRVRTLNSPTFPQAETAAPAELPPGIDPDEPGPSDNEATRGFPDPF